MIVPVGFEPSDNTAESFNVVRELLSVTDFGAGVVTIFGDAFPTTVCSAGPP